MVFLIHTAQNFLIGFSFVTRMSELAIRTIVLEGLNETMKTARKLGSYPKNRSLTNTQTRYLEVLIIKSKRLNKIDITYPAGLMGSISLHLIVSAAN